MKGKFGKLAGAVAAALAAGLFLVQLVPFGRNHANPPVQDEPPWDSPATRAQFMTACGDCHSNETHWPWYSNVAPMSWLVYDHVAEGRSKLNVSEWGLDEGEADEAAEVVQHGEMPLPSYLLLHPEARLETAQKQALVTGLMRTFGSEMGRDED